MYINDFTKLKSYWLLFFGPQVSLEGERMVVPRAPELCCCAPCCLSTVRNHCW